MNYRSLKIACIGFSAFLTMTACASDHDDDLVIDVPATPGVAVSDTLYGLPRQQVLDYFTNTIQGNDAALDANAVLASGEVEAARKYIWDLWSSVVRRASVEKVPTLSSHYRLSGWDKVTTPDAVWSVPEGKLDIFYGSKGERPAAGYPLFLFLHGSGSDSNAEWTAALGWAQTFADGPSAYFIPKSPQGGTGTRWFQPSKQEKWEQLLRQALASDNIDPRKIYIAGISEGAYGSQRLASFYADYLAGAGPIAGGEFLVNCPPENLANIAFCLQTGALDTSYARNLLTQKVGTLLDQLEAQHPGLYNHKVDLQPNLGHGCDYTVATPWLVNYSRNATPKYFYFENFGQGDINGEPRRYRDSFYNLYIVEPSDDRSDALTRTAYEMNISGNTVDLTVNTVRLATNEPVSPATGTVEIGVVKTKTPATSGRVRIYLSDDLVNLSQPVVVKVNGVEKFNGTVEPTSRDLVESCRIFFDPLRLFPASVEVPIP